MECEFIEERDYLRCLIKGSYDLREAVDLLAGAIVRCRGAALTRVLIGYRQMEGYPSATERIIFTEETLDLHEQHVQFSGVPIRIAFLGSSTVLTDYNPGLEIEDQRDFIATITSNPEEAVSFLTD